MLRGFGMPLNAARLYKPGGGARLAAQAVPRFPASIPSSGPTQREEGPIVSSVGGGIVILAKMSRPPPSQKLNPLAAAKVTA